MSLIICYIGSRGTVILGDRRRIGFFGDEKKRESLEKELYNGSIKTNDEMLNKAVELGVTLKITDDAEKIREIGDVVTGEVKLSTTQKVRRKRIYATTNSYSIVELAGSRIEKMQSGGNSIVVLGNKYTKEEADKIIKKHWKKNKTLSEIVDLFTMILTELSKNTPSVGPDYNVLVKNPKLDRTQSRKLIRDTILKDVKELAETRAELKDKLINMAKTMEMASKIMEEGEVGRILKTEGDEVEVMLNREVEALNTDWELIAKPGETITMSIDSSDSIIMGDVVVIEDEKLCIKRTKNNLNCTFILCKTSK